MKENYSFFNSKDHDRLYNAKDWADYFFPLFRTGVFNGHLQVVADEGMRVKVKPGHAWIDGYKYHLWDEAVLDVEMASGNMNRTDSVVIRLDLTNKWVRVFYKVGGYFAGTTIPPAPEISSTIHEIVIAHILVAAGTTRITQDMIEDTRMDKTLCGWVCGAVEQIDFSQITAQFNQFFANYRENISDEFDKFREWKTEKQAEIETWQAEEEKQTDDWQKKETEDFNLWVEDFVNKWESWLLGETKGWQEEIIDWFNNLRERLTENAAVSLQEQIGNLNNLETESRENLVDAINSLTLSYDETMAILAGVGQIDIEIKVLGGDSALGKNVTLHNEVTGRDVTKEYTGGILTFDACCGMEHSIHVEGLEEYTTPDMAEGIVVEEGYTSFLELTYHLKPLSELSWGKIISISEEGRANTLFRLHETKEVELKTGEKVVLEIVGFNHDTLVSDESKTAGITFGMKDCLVQNYRMNATNTNVGGWKDSEMRKTHIREHLYDVLPEELKAGIKQVNKKTSAGNKSSTIETTADDVWLFSQAELGVTGLSAPYSQEGTAYPAFTSNAERIKRGGTNGSTRNYFTRSPYVSNATQFRYITTSGGNSYANATTTSYGMAAGLCV